MPILLHTLGPWPFVCGIMVILGHVYPVFYGFRGGKGAATCIGVLAVLLPGSLVLGAAVWVAVLVASGFVGLATILGMLGVALASFFVPACAAGRACVRDRGQPDHLYTHRSNIERMRAGNENRFERARIWRRR